MKRQRRWWFALVLAALLVSACGPQLTTPTPKVAQASNTPAVPPGPTATKAAPTATAVPLDLADLPVDPDDFHVLGSPDAPVTMVDFSEFQ